VNARVLIVKILLPLLLLATLGMLATLPHLVTADDQGQNDGNHHQTEHASLAVFQVRLEGDLQVPPVSTEAFGFVLVRLFQNGTSSAIDFRLIVCDIANVTHAHIHVGAAGANGNITVPFFDQPLSPVSSTHACIVLAHGVRGPTNLEPRPAEGIADWTDFVHALLSGDTYVNVHTTAHPAGEIRGQLVSEPEQEDDQGDE